MRRLALAALLVALTVLLAACGSGGASADLSGVAQAAAKTEAAGTARIAMTFEAEGLLQTQQAATFSVDGAVDYENERAQLTFDLGNIPTLVGVAGAGSIEMIRDGATMYLKYAPLTKLVGQGKQWLAIDLDTLVDRGVDLGQLQQLDQGDPTQALAYLRAAGDFDEVGTEQVRGVDTTHYTGEIDLASALEKVSGSDRTQLQKLLDEGGASKLPAEAWVDADGYLRKLKLRFADRSGATSAAVSMTMELYDLGSEVTIEPPADDDVTDVTKLYEEGGLQE